MKGGAVPLNPRIAGQIEAEAMQFLGTPYARDFNCMTFVRAVYRAVGLTLPPMALNVTTADLVNPPIGYVLYVQHKQAPRRGYSHVVIILPRRRCIHCSYYFGRKVVITDLDELMALYDIADA